MRAVNLLPKDGQQASRKPQNLPALLSTAAVVLVAGLLGIFYFSAKSTAATKEMELQDAQAELAILPSPDEIAAENAPERTLATEHQARVTALSTAFTHRIAWDRIMREISLVLPEDVWLQTLVAMSPNPATGTKPLASASGQPPTLMTIEGKTYSHDAVARLITRLSVIPDLHNVWLVKSLRTEIAERQGVSFTIVADVRVPGATS